ncbi:retrovirus-related Pol polyprotein from transposon 412 [Trichonephila inaurata madagascariensis]|uniref:Retrovirus-related Pol polyprotein from transposon 412 n=1 Tax=Trichonephila inaurata madagascariensis TaxID=2747483 RepID=A0A8X6YBL2_9ARAC|nr:retrovirus-related Pol polyprotein from transposon 412 [Trichonephila inaurata madagascariensis]
MAREARQHELELRKLELSQQNQPLSDKSGRRVEIGSKIQLTQITTKFDEKHDEIKVELNCEMGHVITKAADLTDSLDQGRYLLGNKTAALLEDYKTKEDVQMHMINAVQTRAQKKLLEVENEIQGQSIEQFDEELNDDLSEDEKKTIEEVLPVVKELSVQDLIKTSTKVFGEEQHKSEQLKPLIADVKLNVSKENKYVLEKKYAILQEKRQKWN